MTFLLERIKIAARWKILVIDSRKIHSDQLRRLGPMRPLPQEWDRLMALGRADSCAQKTLRRLARK